MKKILVAYDATEPAESAFKAGSYTGRYKDFANGETIDVGADTRLPLPAWGWRVLVKTD